MTSYAVEFIDALSEPNDMPYVIHVNAKTRMDAVDKFRAQPRIKKTRSITITSVTRDTIKQQPRGGII